MSTFRFSPRPNRAHEINWQEWGEAAFDRAKKEDRPLLLAISAVWCHWCHVMDETTYSDQGVIDLINGHYIPVRVDNDQRPDINARYNAGGWPSTVLLSPEGEVLTAHTYLPRSSSAPSWSRCPASSGRTGTRYAAGWRSLPRASRPLLALPLGRSPRTS